MPIINITLGKVEKEVKRKLIKEVTEVVMEETGIPEMAFATTITELELDALGLGTKTVEEIIKSH